VVVFECFSKETVVFKYIFVFLNDIFFVSKEKRVYLLCNQKQKKQNEKSNPNRCRKSKD